MKSSDLESARGLLEERHHLNSALRKCIGDPWAIVNVYGVRLDIPDGDPARREIVAHIRGRIERLEKELARLGVEINEPQDQRVVGLDADRLDGTQDEQEAAKAAGGNE